MTDESTTQAQPTKTESSGMPSKTTPASGSRIGDPARRGYGDKTDDESQRSDDSKGKRFDEETDEDAGEGHKGPKTNTNSDSEASTPRSSEEGCCGSDMKSATPSAQSKAGGTSKS